MCWIKWILNIFYEVLRVIVWLIYWLLWFFWKGGISNEMYKSICFVRYEFCKVIDLCLFVIFYRYNFIVMSKRRVLFKIGLLKKWGKVEDVD